MMDMVSGLIKHPGFPTYLIQTLVWNVTRWSVPQTTSYDGYPFRPSLYQSGLEPCYRVLHQLQHMWRKIRTGWKK